MSHYKATAFGHDRTMPFTPITVGPVNVIQENVHLIAVFEFGNTLPSNDMAITTVELCNTMTNVTERSAIEQKFYFARGDSLRVTWITKTRWWKRKRRKRKQEKPSFGPLPDFSTT